ncbi:MAG: Bax inhibitor-1/YccA family protein [Prevotella sp.]|jgi:FtsH-binding integral membrane protein|nr:Bax inhibitor-1/YccA family protein [Prevotella sp.]
MEDRNYVNYVDERDLQASLAFPALMRKVYLWMTLALVITAITAYGVATSPAAIQFILGNRIVFFGLIIAEFALVFAVGGMINRLSITTATLLFTLYSVVNGATLSIVLLAYTQESVTQVFFITAGTFAAMSAVGYLTKRDLSSVGRILFMALIGLIIATVVNIFWKNSGFMAILNYLGVLIFVGLTAYDTQKIKNMLLTAEDGGEVGQKMALLGALTLYLDFINLFLYLLRILGKARD